jgi:hypothetical protein
MAEQEAAEVDEEPEATATAEESDAAEASEEPDTSAGDEADGEDSGMADAVDSRAAEMTGGGDGGGGDDQPISEINRGAVNAAADHLGDANLDADRETLKKIQKGM